MASYEEMTVHYTKNSTLTINHKSFKDAIDFILNAPNFKNQKPLKIVLPKSKKTLCFDHELFRTFLEGDISRDELIETLECDDLYRNNQAIFAGRLEIDPGALWKQKSDLMILIDKDIYIDHPFDKKLFTIATQ